MKIRKTSQCAEAKQTGELCITLLQIGIVALEEDVEINN